jgi:hypothetical protein
MMFAGIVLLLGIAAIAACIFVHRREKAKVRAIESARHAEIAKLDEGYWKATGKVVALETPLVSPMTKTNCLFYHFKIDQQKQSTDTTTTQGRHGSSTRTRTTEYWETVVSDRQAVKSGIEDSSDLIESHRFLLAWARPWVFNL